VSGQVFAVIPLPPPRVFFVRVADKGLMLDAASRASTNDIRLTVERLELNGERFGELSTESQSSEYTEKGGRPRTPGYTENREVTA
jgi:hypothetical protein